ncbi:ATP-binding protein [Falsiroseomonas tokyonensis]|uniref:histidine kinase n=1 Tax=Falsiroseomonas tokyonensis TaxID=430521 RepID=A0ABV7BVR5_9PROT|nr:ATP-binding protein [Falsiroseomonas tokyonensis]MBU8538574.1 response regulator [Falsiroseomonas tokyonensis]
MSIRTRLLWLALIAMVVPALLLGLRSFAERQAQIDLATRRLADTAVDVARDIEVRILSTGQLLFGLARAPELQRQSREGCSLFLARVRAQYPQYTGLLTTDREGRLFCDSLQSGREVSFVDRSYFQRALTTEDGLILDSAFGRMSGSAVLQVVRPVRNLAGDLELVLLAGLDLTRLVREELRLLVPGVEVLLVDSQGTVLVWEPDPSRASQLGESILNAPLGRFALAAGAGQTTELRDEKGAAMIWATGTAPHVGQAGLRILVGQNRQALVAPADRRLRQDLLILALLCLVLGGAVWAIGEVAIRREIGRIAAMARRLGQGDLTARIAPPHPGGELGGLIAVLNRSADSLQQQRDAIGDLNRKLLQAQRMEAVGQLTGGLAHDFNNLLTVIIGSAELLAERLQQEEELLQLAETTRTAAERGGELTRSLLAFARRQPLEPRATDLGAEILRIELLLRRTLGEHVVCRLDLEPGLPSALVDAAQLEAALLNLALNARDAMPDGGQLTVETGLTELDAAYAAQNEEVTPGEYLVIAVTDTGCGMTPEVMAQAFEPFFTTKEFGRGSGLGLSMVYGFVKQSQGHVKIYSEPGHGTSVKIYLPRAAKSDVVRRPPLAPAAALPGGTEAVLVVEDDALVRGHVVGELKHLGYRVLAAGNGQEAMAVLHSAAEVDVLFTDVVMPGGMSGPQLAEAALRMRPGLRVLYTSGYTENAVVHHGRLDPGVVLLSKPYRRQELAEKLRHVLRTAG